MTTNLRAFPYRPHTFPHPTPVSPSRASGEAQNEASGGVECGMCHQVRTPDTWCMDSEVGEYAVCGPCNRPQTGRRMVAVTIALSEPMDSAPLDWAATIASVMRLTYANTTVEVIDSWRVDA